jgi:hypothetical protein
MILKLALSQKMFLPASCIAIDLHLLQLLLL